MYTMKYVNAKNVGEYIKKGIPYIYTKCGAKIGTHTPFILQALGGDEVTMTDKCEKIVTKKTLFG